MAAPSEPPPAPPLQQIGFLLSPGLLESDVGGTGHDGETELPSPCAASSHVLGFELLTPTREGDRQELLSGRGRS